MDDHFTEPPWSADVTDFIYAINGRAGQTTVATLSESAPAELLAAAPDLLRALRDSMECLEDEYGRLILGQPRKLPVLEARNRACEAIKGAEIGLPASAIPDRLWKVDPKLPDAEMRANTRLLDAAPILLAAAKHSHAALAGHADCSGVVNALRNAIVQAGGF